MAGKKEKQKYSVHDLGISDALNIAGIIGSGGLTGQAQDAIGAMQNGGMEAGLNAVSRLLMGALANVATRDQMRGFLFDVWRTTEDEQATEDDLNIQDRLEPRFGRDAGGSMMFNEATGEPLYDKKSLYYRKLKRFHKLPPGALIGISKAVYESDGFTDFLESVSGLLPAGSRDDTSTGTSTSSNGSTVSQIGDSTPSQ